MDTDAQLTAALQNAADGAAGARDHLCALVFGELKALAASHLRHERAGHTLQPTALANEAYIRLLGSGPIDFRHRAEFFAAASTSIRRILVDHARRRNALRRGGDRQRLDIEESQLPSAGRTVDLLALDDALEKLARLDPRQARVVELRFFGGLTVAATADILGVSHRTVEGDWSMARAWLARELGEARRP